MKYNFGTEFKMINNVWECPFLLCTHCNYVQCSLIDTCEFQNTFLSTYFTHTSVYIIVYVLLAYTETTKVIHVGQLFLIQVLSKLFSLFIEENSVLFLVR